MPIRATEIKRGQALMYEGQLHVVLETEHVKPGKGPAYIQAKMKNLQTGTIKTNRLNSADRFEDVSIDRRQLQYLYDAGGRGNGQFVLMDSQTYDQIEVGNDVIGPQQSQWLKENADCDESAQGSDARNRGSGPCAAVHRKRSGRADQSRDR